MIYTCTFNPAIDYRMEVDSFNEGELNRTTYAKFSVGGKGVNVSIVLDNLGVHSVNTGFVGGFTGDFINTYASTDHGLKTDFIKIKELTRLNVKLKSLKYESEINAQGPVVSPEEFEQLVSKIDNMKSGDILAIGGSPSKGSASSYKEIVKLCVQKGIEFVIDTNKKSLEECLRYKPLLIKPNIHELEELFDVSIDTLEDKVFYSRKLLESGAKNVLLSLGKDGSMFITQDKVYQASPIKGVAKNTVGAGDSMVAGFIKGYVDNNSLLESFRIAVACGTATAFSYDLGTKEEIEYYRKKVEIKEVTL